MEVLWVGVGRPVRTVQLTVDAALLQLSQLWRITMQPSERVSTFPRRIRRTAIVVSIVCCGLATGGGAGAAVGHATKTTRAAVDPNAPEVASPGDIPDNIAFVPYRPTAGGFTVTTPEGWSRRNIATGAVFTDKYNIVEIESFAGRAAPTPRSAVAAVTTTVGRSKGFKLGRASTVKRKAGNAVLVTYLVNSAPNAVTGKTLPVAVERYEFFRNGTSVVLTLSGAKGADNVDPWRIVTDSFRWV